MHLEALIRSEPLLADAQRVSIWPWRQTAIGPPSSEVSSHLAAVRPNECYYNAHWLALQVPSAEYVEGFVVFDHEVVLHAWNAIAGRHFDLTWELHFPAALAQAHWGLVQGPWQRLARGGYRFEPQVQSLIEQYRARRRSEDRLRSPPDTP